MKKYNISIILFLFCSFTVYSQNLDIQMPPQEDINKLDKKIHHLFKKTDCKVDNSKLKIYHNYLFKYQYDFEKSDFENKVFLTKLKPYNRKYKFLLFSKYYLVTDSYICDNNDSLLGISDIYYTYSLKIQSNIYLEYSEMVRIITDPNTAIVFEIYGSPCGVYFILTRTNDVFVRKYGWNKNQILPLQEYIDKYWDEFIFWQLNEKNAIKKGKRLYDSLGFNEHNLKYK